MYFDETQYQKGYDLSSTDEDDSYMEVRPGEEESEHHQSFELPEILTMSKVKQEYVVEDSSEISDEENTEHVPGPVTPRKTTRGTISKKESVWNDREHRALFYSCYNQKHLLKARGKNSAQLRKEGWDTVLATVNSVKNEDRNIDKMRNHINDYFWKVKAKNEQMLAAIDKGRKVDGVTLTEALCLKYKGVSRIAGEGGVVIYHTDKVEEEKQRRHKAKEQRKPQPKASPHQAASPRHIPTPKKIIVVPSEEDIKAEHQLFSAVKTVKATSAKSKKTSTPPSSKASTSGVQKKSPPVKPPVAKRPAAASSSAKEHKPFVKPGKKGVRGAASREVHIDLTGEAHFKDDLSDDMVVNIVDDDDIVDMTGCENPVTSTPKGSELKSSLRRSPRLQEKDKPPKSGKSSRKLSFEDETEQESGTQEHNPKDLPPPPFSLDHDLRIAKIESLLSTIEVNRRQTDEHLQSLLYRNTEVNERMLSVLERIASDRHLLLESHALSTKNSTQVVQALGKLIYVTEGLVFKTPQKQEAPLPQNWEVRPLGLQPNPRTGDLQIVSLDPNSADTNNLLHLNPDGSLVVGPTPSAARPVTLTRSPPKVHSQPADDTRGAKPRSEEQLPCEKPTTEATERRQEEGDDEKEGDGGENLEHNAETQEDVQDDAEGEKEEEVNQTEEKEPAGNNNEAENGDHNETQVNEGKDKKSELSPPKEKQTEGNEATDNNCQPNQAQLKENESNDCRENSCEPNEDHLKEIEGNEATEEGSEPQEEDGLKETTEKEDFQKVPVILSEEAIEERGSNEDNRNNQGGDQQGLSQQAEKNHDSVIDIVNEDLPEEPLNLHLDVLSSARTRGEHVRKPAPSGSSVRHEVDVSKGGVRIHVKRQPDSDPEKTKEPKQDADISDKVMEAANVLHNMHMYEEKRVPKEKSRPPPVVPGPPTTRKRAAVANAAASGKSKKPKKGFPKKN